MPWPNGRAFGLAWSRRASALLFGGQVTVDFGGGNHSSWLSNDLWWYDGGDARAPWAFLGGDGVFPRLTAGGRPRAMSDLAAWPAPRTHSSGWVDAADVAWMFGGIVGCCSAAGAGGFARKLSIELWALE